MQNPPLAVSNIISQSSIFHFPILTHASKAAQDDEESTTQKSPSMYKWDNIMHYVSEVLGPDI